MGQPECHFDIATFRRWQNCQNDVAMTVFTGPITSLLLLLLLSGSNETKYIIYFPKFVLAGLCRSAQIAFNLYHSGLIRRQIDIFFLFFQESRIWLFMWIVSIGDKLHELSKPVFWKKKKKKKSVCCLLKILSRVLSVKFHIHVPTSSIPCFRYWFIVTIRKLKGWIALKWQIPWETNTFQKIILPFI